MMKGDPMRDDEDDKYMWHRVTMAVWAVAIVLGTVAAFTQCSTTTALAGSLNGCRVVEGGYIYCPGTNKPPCRLFEGRIICS